MTFLRQLAEFATSQTDPAQDALAMMRLSLLDWAACGIAGQDEPVAQKIRAFAAQEAGTPTATSIGGLRVPARMAALVNGTTSHALDYDDTHFAHIGHPSVAVIPAALAIAEQTGADFAPFLSAALYGVEASVRVGLWLGRDHYQIGYHQTATAGAFGATVAAGRLMGLNQTQMEMALALVSTRASGLKSQFGTMGKPFNAGIAASNGVEAAQLAALGFESDLSALEGTNGFGPTHHGAMDTAAALDGIGQTWLFETISHKFHACCHGLHATLEALAELGPHTADEITAIRIQTHPRWMTVCNKAAPTSGLEAKFSYRMVTAMHLAGYSTAALDTYRDDLCRDPHLQAIMAKVDVTANPDLTETQATVEIDTVATRQTTFDLMAPMTLDLRKSKLHSKAVSIIGAERTEAIWAAINRAAPAKEFAKLIA